MYFCTEKEVPQLPKDWQPIGIGKAVNVPRHYDSLAPGYELQTILIRTHDVEFFKALYHHDVLVNMIPHEVYESLRGMVGEGNQICLVCDATVGKVLEPWFGNAGIILRRFEL